MKWTPSSSCLGFRVPAFFSALLRPYSSAESSEQEPARILAINGKDVLMPLLSLPHRTKLLTKRIETLTLRSHSPWNRQKGKQTQESALLEFDAREK